jgi:hypothetical protein
MSEPWEAKCGPKPKYDPRYHPQLIKWLARGGLTGPQIAAELKIVEKTLYRWAAENPEIKAALKEGRSWVDHLVEDSLLKLALGYEVEQVETKETERKKGTQTGLTVKTVRKSKLHVPAHPTAIIFWLKNRDPKHWRDKVAEEDETAKSAEVRIRPMVGGTVRKPDKNADAGRNP